MRQSKKERFCTNPEEDGVRLSERTSPLRQFEFPGWFPVHDEQQESSGENHEQPEEDASPCTATVAKTFLKTKTTECELF